MTGYLNLIWKDGRLKNEAEAVTDKAAEVIHSIEERRVLGIL